MSYQPCVRDPGDCLKEILAKGDPLETLAEAVDFKRFRPFLEKAAGRPAAQRAAARRWMRS